MNKATQDPQVTLALRGRTVPRRRLVRAVLIAGFVASSVGAIAALVLRSVFAPDVSRGELMAHEEQTAVGDESDSRGRSLPRTR